MDLSWNLSDASQISSVNDALLSSIDSNDSSNILTGPSLVYDEIPEIINTATYQSSLTEKQDGVAGNKRSISFDADELISPDPAANINDHANSEQDMISLNLVSAKLQQNSEPPSKKIKILSDDTSKIPVDAYVLFFKEIQPKIREKNPSIEFDKLSEIGKQMWISLPEARKQEYILRSNRKVLNESVQQTDLRLKTNDGKIANQTVLVSPSYEKNTSDDDDGLRCIRVGCTNIANNIQQRGGPFCSSQCVITHCKTIFDQWVKARQANMSLR